MSATPVNPMSDTAGMALAAHDPLRLAREGILAPAGLDEGRVEQALGVVLGSTVDAADLYFQLSREESWALEDGIVKEGHAAIEQGVGVRALSGEKTGFAYSDEIVMPALEEPRVRRAQSRARVPRSPCRPGSRSAAIVSTCPRIRARHWPTRARLPGWSASIGRRVASIRA